MTLTEQDRIAADRAYVKRFGLHGFIKLAWDIVAPGTDYVDNWHIKAIADHCQAMSDGRWERGVINVSPGSGKSLIVCVFWMAFAWIDRPELCFMYTSYDDKLVLRDAEKCKKIICSEWYRARWPHVRITSGERAANASYTNTMGGARIGASIRGGITGQHADIQVCDDPHKPIDVQSKSGVNLAFVADWWKGTMASRAKDPKTVRRLVIMQRLHEEDLAGVCLADGYEHLCLPMRFEPDRASRTSIGSDPRTQAGELMSPARIDDKACDRLMRELGDHADAQYQQNPSFKGGGPIKQEHFRYWRRLPERFDTLMWSWDCAFKGVESSDYVCGQLWAKSGPNHFLLWRINELMGFSQTLITIKQMIGWAKNNWGHLDETVIEEKANGVAVIEVLKQQVSGIVPINPLSGKEARAHACSYLFRGGNVFFPHPEVYPTIEGQKPWPTDHAETVRKFPRVKRDDTVDAMTQYLLYSEMRDAKPDMIKALEAHMRISA